MLPGPARGHGRGRQPADVERAVEIHVEHEPPGVGIELEEVNVAIDAGHLHRRVKGPLVALHRRHQRLDRAPVADVALVGHRGATARPDRLRRLRAGAHVGHGELVAVAARDAAPRPHPCRVPRP